MTIRRVMYLGIAAALLAAAPATAQGKIELTPFFGSYYGVATITDDADNGNPAGTKLQQLPAPGLGGRVTVRLAGSLAAEAEGFYTWSGVRIFSDDPQFQGSISLKATMLGASGRIMYRPPRTNFHVLGGVGIIRRSGEFWDFIETQITGAPLEKLTTVAGVIGFGVRAAVTPSLALNVTVEAYVSKFDPQSNGTSVFNKTNGQPDVIVTIGVPLSLMK